ncbi:MAG: MFS transporter, partial [Candidatus Acidiferrales bacterium]
MAQWKAMAVAEKVRPSGRVAFSHPNFTLFLSARSCIVLALEMQSVAVGWQVYDITKKPLDLGLIGLAQFLPSLLLFLVSGHVTDRVNRRQLLTICYLGFATCSALLLTITFRAPRAVLPIYGVVVLSGVVRAFNGPATRAILPQLIP